MTNNDKYITKDLISVVVPVYNAATSFLRCLDSIISQTYKDLEVIIVDDGSNDGTEKLCDEYAEKDSRIKVIHQKNGGVSMARNTGIECANGKYITFCDCDDYYDTDWVENLSTNYSEPNCDLVAGRFKSVYANGNSIETSCYENSVIKLVDEMDRLSFIVNQVLSNRLSWSVCIHLFQTDIIKNRNIRFNTRCENFAEDLGFYLEYTLYINTIVRINHCGYNYYMTPNSMMDRSKDIIKFNSLNEVSFGLYTRLVKENFRTLIKNYPIIHFMIMNNQYRKIVGSDKYQCIGTEISKIQKLQWYKETTKSLDKHIPMLFKLLKKSCAYKALTLSHYCLNQNWWYLSVMSALYYRFINSNKEKNQIVLL